MDESLGEKTEQPTQRRLDDAIKKGQFPRSMEVQTVFVLLASLLALTFTGQETWRQMVGTMATMLGHLHDVHLSFNLMQSYTIQSVWIIIQCSGPLVLAAGFGGLLAGGIQSRFRTASEALEPNWERLNPVVGFQRVFSFKSAAPTALAALKFCTIILLSYSEIRAVLSDPIFYSSVGVARIAEFLAQSAFHILLRVTLILMVLAALDYGYQAWNTHKELMMTKEEVKEDSKSSDGNPHVRSMQRRKGRLLSKRKMLLEVPRADVVVTNPTHIAVALRYDPKTMKAPRVVAKGIRLNALRIRELARQHQVPILENPPLARLLFKYGRLGGEVPAQLYAAVAEVLAWVYRANRSRYYLQQNQVTTTKP